MKKDIKFIVFPIVAIVIIALGYFLMKPKEVTTEQTVAPAAQASLNRSSAFVKGNPDAKVTVVEFFDPECEGCAGFHPILMQIMKEFPNDVKLEARYMLFHGNSYDAALALEGAGKQGKYWEMYNFLLERQQHWSHQEESVRETFEMYASELGLNLEEFNKSYDDFGSKAVIAQDASDGKLLNVNGTPTLFINGAKLERLSYEDLKQKIQSEIQK